jgi:hypothetical protein
MPRKGLKVVLRQHTNCQDKSNLDAKEGLKVVLKQHEKPPMLKKSGNGKWISAVSKEARPKRTEGKRHRNQNG